MFGPKRYALIEATTKAGKTAGCLVWLFEKAALGREGQNFWWVAPVYSQARIAFRRMKRAIPRTLYRSNDSDHCLTLANGTTIWFKSGEKSDNLYGEDVFAGVIDEASRVSEDAWIAVRSTITATAGPLRIIGNVKGRANWFYRMARLAERGALEDSSYAKVTWRDAVKAKILTQAEIDNARGMLSPSVFAELYEAEAAELSGRVYRDFRTENLREDLVDLGGDVLIGMDFNVDPMCAVIASRAGDQLHVWDEIVMTNSNTQEMASEIRARLPKWQARADELARGVKASPRTVRVYPDPSGTARKTSARAGETDFTILRDAGFKVIAGRQATLVVDRINEVNGLACNAKGLRRLFVHPKRCPHLAEALEQHTYKEGTSQPDKESGFDHPTDALGYLVHEEFPIRSPRVGTLSSTNVIGA